MRGGRSLLPVFPVMMAACAVLPSCTPLAARNANERIISIDYCADQMVLGLVDRRRIAAVSVDVASDPAFSLPRSTGLPRVRASIEQVIALRPTLVVRSYGGGPRMEAALRRAGIPVFTLPYAGDISAVRASIIASGERLTARAAALARLRQLDHAIAMARARANRRSGEQRPTGLYLTPGDVTTGPQSLVAELMRVAGYASYEQRPGWHRLPVERLVLTKPDIVVRGFFETTANQQDRWSSAQHRALAHTLQHVPVADVAGSDLACGNWLAGNALDAISAAGTGGAS